MTIGLHRFPNLFRFAKFATVGFSSTVIDFALLNLFAAGLNLNIYLSASLAFLCAATSGYFLNRAWTFESARPKQLAQQYLQFVCVGSVGLAINLLMMAILINGFGVHYNVAKMGAVVLVSLWNFTMNSRWTFAS